MVSPSLWPLQSVLFWPLTWPDILSGTPPDSLTRCKTKHKKPCSDLQKKSHYSSLSGPFPASLPLTITNLYLLHHSCYANVEGCGFLNFSISTVEMGQHWPRKMVQWSTFITVFTPPSSQLSSSLETSVFFCKRPCHRSLSLPFICSSKHLLSIARLLKPLSIITKNSIHHATRHFFSSIYLNKSCFN